MTSTRPPLAPLKPNVTNTDGAHCAHGDHDAHGAHGDHADARVHGDVDRRDETPPPNEDHFHKAFYHPSPPRKGLDDSLVSSGHVSSPGRSRKGKGKDMGTRNLDGRHAHAHDNGNDNDPGMFRTDLMQTRGYRSLSRSLHATQSWLP